MTTAPKWAELNRYGVMLREARRGVLNLWRADLGDANLRGADLEGADLRDANLRGAHLEGAVGLKVADSVLVEEEA